MKSIIGNAVNLSIADVRFHRVLPADTVMQGHAGKKGEVMGRAIGNADSACGILMAVLETSCALWFVYVFTRARTHAWENTRFYSLHFRGPFGKELWRMYDR